MPILQERALLLPPAWQVWQGFGQRKSGAAGT